MTDAAKPIREAVAQSRAEERAAAFREYHPCSVGLHVCGATQDGERPLTIANYPMKSADEARRIFDLVRKEFGEREGDLVVDLFIGPYDLVDDFETRRQMLPRIAAAVAAAAKERA